MSLHFITNNQGFLKTKLYSQLHMCKVQPTIICSQENCWLYKEDDPDHSSILIGIKKKKRFCQFKHSIRLSRHKKCLISSVPVLHIFRIHIHLNSNTFLGFKDYKDFFWRWIDMPMTYQVSRNISMWARPLQRSQSFVTCQMFRW